MEEYPEFDEFISMKNWSFWDRMLLQAVAILSTQDQYSYLEPTEVFNLIREQTIEIIKGE
jgi:hypothetical protein